MEILDNIHPDYKSHIEEIVNGISRCAGLAEEYNVSPQEVLFMLHSLHNENDISYQAAGNAVKSLLTALLSKEGAKKLEYLHVIRHRSFIQFMTNLFNAIGEDSDKQISFKEIVGKYQYNNFLALVFPKMYFLKYELPNFSI